MRAGILFWSTLSGILLGLFIDAALIGVALLFRAVVPGISGRLGQRWVMVVVIVVLLIIPLASAVLGFLEGRLKAT